MKYLNIITIITFLLLFLLSYGGYYLYNYDKGGPNRPTVTQNKIPEYLTEEFWQNVTTDQLREKLKNIKNINIVRSDTHSSMLHLLILYGKYPEMVDLLINAGIDYHINGLIERNKEGKDRTSLRPIHLASYVSSGLFLQKILEYDTDINKIGYLDGAEVTPLFFAVNFKLPSKIIKMLLEKGADPDILLRGEGDISYTPFAAVFMPNTEMNNSFIDPEVVQLFLDYDADINKIGLLEGNEVTPLLLAAHSRSPSEIIKMLFEKGADPDILLRGEGDISYTPFVSVFVPDTETGNSFIDPEVVQLFLDYNADISIQHSIEGKTAYDFMKENEEFRKTPLFKKLSLQLQKTN